MKTLAEAKRRIKVGTKIHVDHELPHLTRDTEVVKVQTNAIVTRCEPTPSNRKGWSWCRWPKVAEVRVEGDTIHFLNADGFSSRFSYTITEDAS